MGVYDLVQVLWCKSRKKENCYCRLGRECCSAAVSDTFLNMKYASPLVNLVILCESSDSYVGCSMDEMHCISASDSSRKKN